MQRTLPAAGFRQATGYLRSDSWRKSLAWDFTTVARGYTEARRRGLLSSQVGSGTFVTAPNGTGTSDHPGSGQDRVSPPDFSMNLPPEPNNRKLVGRMQAGYSGLSGDLMPLLRYQTLETSEQDQLAAARWLEATGLSPDPSQILFASGAQARPEPHSGCDDEPGDQIACEDITYPGSGRLQPNSDWSWLPWRPMTPASYPTA